VAVFLSINSGYDPEYPWKQIGTDNQAADRQLSDPLAYYLTPVDAGGEPPGVWHGLALARLGISEGSIVDKAEFIELFGKHVDPETGERLGRASYQFKSENDIYAALVAAEPYASEARKDELRSQARHQARRAVPFFDFTMSVSKDISLVYVWLLVEAESARRAGDLEAAERWAEQAAKVPYWIEQGREALMKVMQEEAGYTRTGYHRGSGVESRAELGRFDDAHEWVYASFFQHTSRDDDPQLHIHNLVLNKVPVVRDGKTKWLTIDAQVAYGMKRWAASVAAATIEAGLSSDLGVVWERRPDGNGRQIKGVSQEMMDKFSHRRQVINAKTAEIAAEREAKWGKAPTARQLDRIQRDITQRTRKGKESAALDLAGLLKDWETSAEADDLEGFRAMGREVAREGERYRARREVVARTAELITAELEQRDDYWGDPHSPEEAHRISAYAGYITQNGALAGPVDPFALAEGYARTRDADLTELVEAANRYAAEEIVAQTTAEMHARLEEQTGRSADAVEYARMERFASWVTRGGQEQAQFDTALLLRAWQAQEAGDVLRERDIRRDTERAQTQADVLARSKRMTQAMARAEQETGGGRLGAMERAYAVAYPAQHDGGLTEDQAQQVIAEALDKAQQVKTKWPKADLAARILDLLPEGAQSDRETANMLAERALAGEPVVLLDPPVWPMPPASLRRADGESVFVRHGTTQYAAQAQLDLEQLLLSQAQDPAAPRLRPEVAARFLGADPARLEALLSSSDAPPAAALSERATSGLRADQAAAAFFVLTSARRAEVLAGPAGTGKTRTAAELAKAWSGAGMGPVVALTTTSSARDVIRDEAERRGAPMAAYNTAEWLGHLPGAREARPGVELQPGTLLILDEASMMTVPDLAAIVRRATARGAKVVLTGDPEQLQAPESGGGMTLLASRLGWVQLIEPQRFRQQWERGASLRLRAGDADVLADYRRRARLHSGSAEAVLEDAARAWTHAYLNGKDVLLMTGTEAAAAELSRRVRDDLVHWGKVSDGPVIRIRDGQHASAGDLVMARRNDKVIGTDREQGITNRDMLRIVAVDSQEDGQWVRVQRLTGRDDQGHELWSAVFDLPAAYVRADTQLGYAVTWHSAEGATVDEGISVFTGTEDRQSVNVGMTRGRNRNDAYVISNSTLADPAPGTRSAPELDRYHHLEAERQGWADPPARDPAKSAAEAEAILAQCLNRDGREPSALEYQEKAWSDADRLDALAVQWQHATRDADRQRYADAVHAVLPQEEADSLLADPAVSTLWLTLREAEHAGISPAEALSRAAGQGPLGTAESLAKVVNWRVRQFTDHTTAQPAGPWTERAPQTGDPDADQFAAELAAAMDDRTRRLGSHAAEHPPAWAKALGPVPADPLERLEWEHKAAQVAAYREMHGHEHPADPIGPRPGQHSPEARAMWQAAAAALGYTTGDLSDKTDGNLWARRRAYDQEMSWQPPYPGDDVTVAREKVRRHELNADRKRRDAEVADPENRELLLQLAAGDDRQAQQAREQEQRLARQAEAYGAWDAVTRTTREYALAADAELRRRHPETLMPPLQAPTPVPAAAEEARPPLVPALPVAEPAEYVQPPLFELPEIPAPAPAPDPSRQAEERAADLMAMELPAEDPDVEPEVAWSAGNGLPGALEAFGEKHPLPYEIKHDPAHEVPAAEALHQAQANDVQAER
jgi:hypothetical protein